MIEFHEGNTGTFTVIMTMMKPDYTAFTRTYGPYTKTKARNLQKKLNAKYGEREDVLHIEISQLWTAAWMGDSDD